MRSFLVIAFLLPLCSQAQVLTNSTNLDIEKTWFQEPDGYTFPVAVYVPDGDAPDEGFPVCVLLHGFGGQGFGMVNDFSNLLDCHILLGPTGYENSWNIVNEPSDAPDVEMISELIENVQQYENVNPDRVRLLGISNGSALCNRLFIENKNEGIDVICAIVSQLSEGQFHNDGFYYPDGETSDDLPYNGYTQESTPLSSRKYLGIFNVNDMTIPYDGGLFMGINFLPAQEAIFRVAQSQGYTGTQLSGSGEDIGGNVFEYSYLSGQVVHLRGFANHGFNEVHREYIDAFFNDCQDLSNINEMNRETGYQVFPNPFKDKAMIRSTKGGAFSYEVFSTRGEQLLRGISENKELDFSALKPGVYFLRIENRLQKIVKF